MRNLLFLLIFVLVPAQAHAVVIYVWQPHTPSLEGGNYEGRIVVSDEAFNRGSTTGSFVNCDTVCVGSNDGLESFEFTYFPPPPFTTEVVLSGTDLLKPILIGGNHGFLGSFSWSFDLGDTLVGSFDSLGIFEEFDITQDGEFYLDGSDLTNTCGYQEETQFLCRGSFGTWARVPEPPAVALICLAATGLGIVGHRRRSGKKSTPC